MKTLLSFIAAFMLALPLTGLATPRVNLVRVSKLADDVYKIEDSSLRAVTRGCLIDAQKSKAILLYNPYKSYNKIIFEDSGDECELLRVVDTVCKPIPNRKD